MFMVRSLFSCLVLVSFFNFSFAQTSPIPAPIPPQLNSVISTSSSEVITVATVNIHNPKIVEQKGNIVTISFDISNRKGAQPQIKYSVQLIKNSDRGQVLMDEKVYDETISLSENDRTNKRIIYQVPANLKGEYTILISSKNTNGFPLALALVGKVNLSIEGNIDYVEIIPETCFLKVEGEVNSPKYSPLQGVDVLSDENLVAVCVIKSNASSSVTLTPNYETYYRTIYGEKVLHEGGDTKSITLEPKEEKIFSFVLPKAKKPQAYDAKVSFDGGNIQTNSVVFHYVLRGPSATIQNIVLDKDYYQVGDIAKVSFMWSPSADSFPGSRLGKGTTLSDVYLTLSISDINQKKCTAQIDQIISENAVNPIVEIFTPIISSCKNPQVSLFIKDNKGDVLTEESFIIETKAIPNTSNQLYFFIKIIMVSILGFILFIGIILYVKKIKNEAKI